MVGAMNAESFQTYHSYANTFEMPIVVPWYPMKSEKVSEVLFSCFVLFSFPSLQILLSLCCIVAVQQLGKSTSSSQNGLCHSHAPRSAPVYFRHYRLLWMEEHNLHVQLKRGFVAASVITTTVNADRKSVKN